MPTTSQVGFCNSTSSTLSFHVPSKLPYSYPMAATSILVMIRFFLLVGIWETVYQVFHRGTLSIHVFLSVCWSSSQRPFFVRYHLGLWAKLLRPLSIPPISLSISSGHRFMRSHLIVILGIWWCHSLKAVKWAHVLEGWKSTFTMNHSDELQRQTVYCAADRDIDMLII